ncbi:ThiF family adenylyltransferase [Pedobacter sp. AJM]|uniref:ThiF family adenylyltransferase n=1 Tax=Pedobacter sp. AJM TaxID=2003629 RepID=UPI000B4AEFDB|nr:ThiF family adenylyltransferase [Pedobacter sp. AJM]OWK71403.1 hypothetical protein CBW18_10115 [Pedobacter sp. AJM]
MNTLRISGHHYGQLKEHLFPGDNKEAVAVALCGRSVHKDNEAFLVQELLLVPYDLCDREKDYITWPTDIINPFLEKAAKRNLAIVKFHCHPGPGVHEYFSDLDDFADQTLFKSIQSWLDNEHGHASCIMLPDGRLFGRVFREEMQIEPLHKVLIAGSDVQVWRYFDGGCVIADDAQIRNKQAFGEKTISELNKMKIGVVGCSGTGSITIEQLKRLGVGELVLVDPDYIDGLNLNRIIGSKRHDADIKEFKTEVMKREILALEIGTKVTTFTSDISKREVVKELSDCDFLFSCVDGAEGRHMLNLISSFYILPLIDMGVKLNADGKGGINNIFGQVHFIQPGGSSLLNRHQYGLDRLLSESIKRVDGEEHARNQYLANVGESSPAVISINMQVSATAINDFLARIHPFRNMPNSEVDIIKIDYTDCVSYSESMKEPCLFFNKWIGRGDIEPLLNSPELSKHVQKVH